MAKKAKKKSGVSRAARTVKKAASSAARSTRKAVKKMMPRKKAKKIFTALIEQLNDQTPGIILRAKPMESRCISALEGIRWPGNSLSMIIHPFCDLR